MAKRTILVVDDESHVTYVLAHKLRQTGAEVLTAGDGVQGYELACLHHPDLIVTDFQMPNLSGYDMAVKLCDNPQTAQTPLLMLTARGHRITPTELSRTNIQFILAKPFSARELMAKVSELLGPEALPQPAPELAASTAPAPPPPPENNTGPTTA